MNNAAAFGANEFHGFLGGEQRSEYVEVRVAVEEFFRASIQWGALINAALFTRMLSLPEAFFVSTKRRVMSACLETSPCTAIALPRLAVISSRTRSAPSLLDE